MRGSRLGSLCGTLWHPVHGTALCRAWRGVLGDAMREKERAYRLGRALRGALGRHALARLRSLLLTLPVCILYV